MARWLVVPVALVLLAGSAAWGEEEIVDGIAAQVGGDIVLVSEVFQVAAPAEAEMRRQGASKSDVAALRAEVLERLIERALIRQVVKRAELGATDAEVDEAIAAIARENGLTPDQLRQSVADQGLPFEAYRERIRDEIEQSKVVNGMVASRVRVDEEAVRARYEKQFADQPQGGTEVRLRHLLVAFDGEKPGDRAQACAQVGAALARVRGGEPFEAVAAEVSQVNPRQGGDIGWIHGDQMARWMADPLRGLDPGDVSDVLETDFGCNLLQLVERREYEPISFERAEEPLRRQLFNEGMSREYQKFLEDLRNRTYVERKGIFADADAGVAAGGASGGSGEP